MIDAIRSDELMTLRNATIQPLITMDLAAIQYSVFVVADENAPHFVPANEPLADGRTYQATTGQLYYRPQFRLATRAGQVPGPDVRFLKDANGKVRLQIELEETPAGFANAQPFAVRVSSLTLNWGSGSKVLPQPTIFFDNERSADQPRILIRAGVETASNEIEPLYQGMQNSASLQLALSYGYWVDEPQAATPTVPTGTLHINPHLMGAMRFRDAVTIAQPAISAIDMTTVRLNQPVIGRFKDRAAFDWTRVVEIEERLATHPNFKTASLTRPVSLRLDAGLAQNRPIYAAIRADDDSLRTVWTDTAFGFIRQAEFANTVYRLPDELRLAFNPALGAPHVIPQLYRDTNDEVRVRVTLRVIPYHNPQKLIALRDFLYRDSAGGLANPSVIVGGYEKATLRFTTAFPEEITLLGGSELNITLENGVDMTLDLSLEFYRYLAELLTSPIGITGEVTVILQTDTDGTQLIKRVPLRLVLDELAGIGMETRPIAQTVSPTQIELVNVARCDIQIGDCVPRLLQVDENSVVPLAVFQASSTTIFPSILAAGMTLLVEFEPRNVQDEVWNGVQIELTGQRITQSPRDVLNHIHEIAPSGSLAWKIKVECPLFKAPQLPDQFAMLYRVRVEIKRGGYAPQQVILGRDAVEGAVTMQRSLREIVGQDSADATTFTYRVQNVYFDREGTWSEERTAQGENLFVFPNASE
jgi:hypothetical protein